jgi:hypothetical protein
MSVKNQFYSMRHTLSVKHLPGDLLALHNFGYTYLLFDLADYRSEVFQIELYIQ